MTERTKLFKDSDFEKIEIARFLVNNLTLYQLLTIENMVKSGQLKEIMKKEKQSDKPKAININELKQQNIKR